MIANEARVKPTVRDEVAELSAWLYDHPELEPQDVSFRSEGVRITFPRECFEAFRKCFTGPAKLRRSDYGRTAWFVVVRGRVTYECYAPVIPELEDVTL